MPTIDALPPPTDKRYHARISPVPPAVVRRSTFRPGCPVSLEDLAYVRTTYWGFDHEPHRGELLVAAPVAQDIVGVFRRLYAARFPIEQMTVTSMKELKAHPTGDGNDTGAFVCRRASQSTSWSEHAFGLAIDVNPFQNPYVSDDLVLPELASSYRNRSWKRPGMITPNGVVVRAFASIGWEWGGSWASPKDYMHFSASGR